MVIIILTDAEHKSLRTQTSDNIIVTRKLHAPASLIASGMFAAEFLPFSAAESTVARGRIRRCKSSADKLPLKFFRRIFHSSNVQVKNSAAECKWTFFSLIRLCSLLSDFVRWFYSGGHRRRESKDENSAFSMRMKADKGGAFLSAYI